MLNFFLWVMAMNIAYTSCALELTGFINAQIFDGLYNKLLLYYRQ